MTSPFPFFPAEADPLAGITRCIRRICLLHEQGNTVEAISLQQGDFGNALRDFRLAHGPDSLPDAELRSMFEAEKKRVADAVVLSELLIPQLIKSFPAAAASAPQIRPAAAAVAPARDTAVPFPRAAAAAGVSPVIADLLDAMLASERGGRRPASANG